MSIKYSFLHLLVRISKAAAYRTASDMTLAQIRLATEESAKYVTERMTKARAFNSRQELLKWALSQCEVSGLFCELGVYKGDSLNLIAQNRPEEIIHGFDTFEGLPEDWRPGFYKKAFSLKGELPVIAHPNVELHKGLFADTLPLFLEKEKRKLSFAHVDCDLYESTKVALNLLADRIGATTILVFDEYINFPGWQQHEFKAFHEFSIERKLSYQYIGYCPLSEQVAIRING
jgi:hypothetical protein